MMTIAVDDDVACLFFSFSTSGTEQQSIPRTDLKPRLRWVVDSADGFEAATAVGPPATAVDRTRHPRLRRRLWSSLATHCQDDADPLPS